MKRSYFCVTCVAALALISTGAAPSTQPGASREDQNRALRDALVDLNLKNRALESENAKLKMEVNSLRDQMAKIAVPNRTPPYLYQSPSPFRLTPSQPTDPNPAPKNWVPKKYGDLDFYVIPLHSSCVDGQQTITLPSSVTIESPSPKHAIGFDLIDDRPRK